MWDRPPNFLLVDFYNYGNFNGSVFEVAAEMNNVTYDRECCGVLSGTIPMISAMHMSTVFAVAAGVLIFSSAF